MNDVEVLRPGDMRRILISFNIKQHTIIRSIAELTKQNGIAPVMGEIIEYSEIARSTVQYHVAELVARNVAIQKSLSIYREKGGRPPAQISLTQLGRALYQFGTEKRYKPYS